MCRFIGYMVVLIASCSVDNGGGFSLAVGIGVQEYHIQSLFPSQEAYIRKAREARGFRGRANFAQSPFVPQHIETQHAYFSSCLNH